MKKAQIITNLEVKKVFNTYPSHAHNKIQYLRDLIIEVANECDDIDSIEETLKWGEPSYLVKKGSTIRIDWKAKQANQYAMYFKCTSSLVSTFKEVYGDLFEYEKNRAILFHMNDIIPKDELKNCIKAALRYHKVKQLPLLGMK